tara:strand:- start:658 stop:762 length:105 start_codon:yes stop_codon:yes gene_type:complete
MDGVASVLIADAIEQILLTIASLKAKEAQVLGAI